MINTHTFKEEFTEVKSVRNMNTHLQKLIDELNKKDLNEDVTSRINSNLQELDTFQGDKKQYKKKIQKSFFHIQELVRKEQNIVSSGHYIAIWMSIGMGAFGMPIGVLAFVLLDNPAFIALGLPLGMPIGIVIGLIKTQKAKKENRVIEI